MKWREPLPLPPFSSAGIILCATGSVVAWVIWRGAGTAEVDVRGEK